MIVDFRGAMIKEFIIYKLNKNKKYLIFLFSFMIVPTSLTTYYSAAYLGLPLAFLINSFCWANVCWFINNRK